MHEEMEKERGGNEMGMKEREGKAPVGNGRPTISRTMQQITPTKVKLLLGRPASTN